MFRTVALAGALSLALATGALAATSEFDNMCVEGLALHQRDQDRLLGEHDLQGQDLLLRHEHAKQDFMKDPAANPAKAEQFYSKHQG